MENDAEDHNYRHHGYRDTGGGGGGLNGVTISPGDIFQITGSTPAVFVGNLRKLSQEHVHRNPHNHQARHTYHKSQQKTCLTNKNESCRNNNVVISPTDFFQLEQIDDGKPNRGLSLGNLFSTGGSHAYTALTRALDSSTSAKTPVDSCGDSGTLDTTGSTTALLETAGRCSGADKKRRQGEDDECCEPAFLVGWNWPAIRIGCLLLCVSCLVAVLCVVVVVLLLRPTPCDPERSWWQGAVMYEVFVASFVDSDGDGFGDFAGLTSRLGYIRNRIGASAIRLTSVFSALDYQLEYEHIIDFDNVDPHLEHVEDFAIFVERAHEIGLRVVLDINLAVTSDQLSWAAHWLLDPYGEYRNYYVLMNDSSIMLPVLTLTTPLTQHPPEVQLSFLRVQLHNRRYFPHADHESRVPALKPIKWTRHQDPSHSSYASDDEGVPALAPPQSSDGEMDAHRRLQTIKEATINDATFTNICRYVSTEWPERKDHLPDALRPYWNYRDELHIEEGRCLGATSLSSLQPSAGWSFSYSMPLTAAKKK
ncbi:uncharacterized protein LOC144163727 [Haemaphysalis longicornis]